MRIFATALAALTLVVLPYGASAGEVTDLASPSGSDYAAAEQVAKPVIDQLVARKPNTAIDLAFNDNPMFENIKPQIPALKGQLAIVIQAYGNVIKCELAQRSHKGSLLINLKYLCQHEHYVTQWDFMVLHAQKGWILGKINFEDAS